MKRWDRKMLAGLGLAGLLAASTVFPGLADGQEPDVLYVPDFESLDQGLKEKLQDHVIEYGELGNLIRYYNPAINASYQAVYYGAVQMGDVQRELKDEIRDLQSELDDLKKAGGSKESMDAIRDNMRQLSNYVNTLGGSIRDFDKSSAIKSLNFQLKQQVYSAQMLMNTYWQQMANREVVAKSVELAQADLAAKQAMSHLGMTVDTDLLAAQADLSSAKTNLSTLDAALVRMRQSLYILTGQDAAQAPELGGVPSPDLAWVEAINVEEDAEKAVGNNRSLISLRSAPLNAEQDYINRAARARLLNINMQEGDVRANIHALYGVLSEKKAAYDAAASALGSAQIQWNGAQVQRQTGMLSDVQYIQQELAYLQAKSAFTSAKLALQQSIQNYDWAVKGLSISGS